MKKVIVVVPLHKPELETEEEKSLKQLFKILGKHEIYGVLPNNLSLDYYDQFPFTGYYRMNPKYFANYNAYNMTMLDVDYYNQFMDYEYIFTYEVDAWVFKDELLYWCDKGYDYIGAPWLYTDFEGADAPYCGNSGFCLRKVSWMINFINNHKPDIDKLKNTTAPFYNDNFLAKFHNEGNFATFVDCARFSFEANPHMMYQIIDHQQPFGCHAYNKVVHKYWYKYKKWIE